MKRKLAIAVIVMLGLTGCATDNFKDLENVEYRDPDKAEGYNNVNGHPNVGRICIDGVAFATTTREYTAVIRVPEWDTWCGASK